MYLSRAVCRLALVSSFNKDRVAMHAVVAAVRLEYSSPCSLPNLSLLDLQSVRARPC